MRRSLFAAVATLVAVAGLTAPAGAQVAPTTTVVPPPAPTGLSVTSDQPPYVIVVPGETTTLASTADVTCPAGWPAAELTFWAAPTANDPRVIDAVVVPSVAPGTAAPVSAPLTIPAGTPQGTYAAGIVCQEVPTAGTPQTQLVAEGWIVVGDANRLPPSDGVATVPAGTDLTADSVVDVAGTGFAADATVQVWLYSTPQLLGSTLATAVGDVATQVAMPAGTELGAHTMVLAGVDSTGRPRFLTLGVAVGAAAAQAPTTATSAPPATVAGAPAPPATLPATGAGAGLAVPAVGLLGLGGLLASLSRWWHRSRRVAGAGTAP